jgi:predicted TIM-barrel fold metal-dependent hydrolase
MHQEGRQVEAMTMHPIIDSHVHLWNPAQLRIPWLDDIPLLNHAYGLGEYREQTQGLFAEAIVYVEVNVVPEQALQEAQWVSEQAGKDSRLQGIVAFAPVEQGVKVRTHLEQLVKIDPRIKGVRRNLQDETMPGFCLQPAFVEGVRMLPEFNLSFDLCIVHTQLRDVISLVQQCPDTQFILDHIAKPHIRDHVLDPWRGNMRELAALPNVVCKISGMVTEADHQDWIPEDLAPYVAHVLTVFGEERVMFGGDWPVVLRASSLRRWVEVLETLTADLSIQAKQAFWVENARRVYRLQG